MAKAKYVTQRKSLNGGSKPNYYFRFLVNSNGNTTLRSP